MKKSKMVIDGINVLYDDERSELIYIAEVDCPYREFEFCRKRVYGKPEWCKEEIVDDAFSYWYGKDYDDAVYEASRLGMVLAGFDEA